MNVVNAVLLLHIDFAVHDSFAGIGPCKKNSKKRIGTFSVPTDIGLNPIKVTQKEK